MHHSYQPKSIFHAITLNQAYLTGVACVLFFLASLPLTTSTGHHVMAVLDDYGSGVCSLVIGFFEAIGLCWVFGVGNVIGVNRRMEGKVQGKVGTVCSINNWTLPMKHSKIFSPVT